MGAGEGSKCDAFKIFGKEDVMKKKQAEKAGRSKNMCFMRKGNFWRLRICENEERYRDVFPQGIEV